MKLQACCAAVPALVFKQLRSDKGDKPACLNDSLDIRRKGFGLELHPLDFEYTLSEFDRDPIPILDRGH